MPIIVYLVAAILVSRIPYVRSYLALFPTLLNEVLRNLIGGGKSLMNHDPLLETAVHRTFKHDLISYGSYTVTTLASIGLFYLVSIQHYHLILYILIGFIAVSLVLWIRRLLEFLWALSFIALLALPFWFGYGIAIKPAAIFLSSYILVQSVLNAFRVCRQSCTERKRKGIAAKVKWIPSMILGLALLGQSLYAGYFVVSHFIFHIGLPWTKLEFVQLPWV